MALPHIIRRFEVELADVDRGHYEALSLRVAQHPSETDRFLVARVVARCLCDDEGVDFSAGLGQGDDPAIWQHDLRGDVVARIEVGHPSPDRLHKATRSGARVVVYTWRAPEALAAAIVERGVFAAESIELFALDRGFLEAVAGGLGRKNAWSLSVSGGVIYLDAGAGVHSGAVRRVPIGS